MHGSTDVMRKIAVLALVGFGAIVLSGPILAILSIVLSLGTVVLGFALVGFMIWLPFRILVAGQQVALQNVHALGHGLARAGGQVFWLASLPFRWAARLSAGVLFLLLALLRLAFSTTRFVLEVSIVAGVGALVGALIGLVFDSASPDLGLVIATNALAGSVIGALVAIVMTWQERRPAIVRPQHVTA
jgi:hypothetical protein